MDGGRWEGSSGSGEMTAPYRWAYTYTPGCWVKEERTFLLLYTPTLLLDQDKPLMPTSVPHGAQLLRSLPKWFLIFLPSKNGCGCVGRSSHAIIWVATL